MAADRVTIPQLALELGVSVGTVSSALSGTGRVAPATRQRVIDHAAARGYRKNSAARNLRVGATQAIELHLPRNARHLSFYIDFAFGVVDAAAAAGLDVLLTTADRPRSGGLLAADGAVFIDAEEDSKRLRELIAFGVPVVAADGAPVPGPKPSLSIDINYDEVIGHLLRSAVASGARRPMLIAPDLSLASSWRDRVTAAFERWCEHLGVSGSVRMFPVNGPDADIIALVRGELEQKNAPDTMIFAGQRLAAVCSAALHIGYANSAVPWISSCAGDPLSEVNAPQISALDTQPHEFGRRSGEALAGLISAGKLPSATHEAWPTRIAWAEHWARVD